MLFAAVHEFSCWALNGHGRLGGRCPVSGEQRKSHSGSTRAALGYCEVQRLITWKRTLKTWSRWDHPAAAALI